MDEPTDAGCICQRCGRRYKVDFIVDDTLWAHIRPASAMSPDAGLLCGSCIIAEAIEGMDFYGVVELKMSMGPPKGKDARKEEGTDDQDQEPER